MSNDSTGGPRIVLDVSSAEAEMIVEGLQVLLNCKRFARKDPHTTAQELLPEYFAVVERVGEQVRRALKPAADRPAGGATS